MANPEHVEIVKQGTEAIGEWRERNPGERLDLSDADLSEAVLRRADLRRADLSEANLSGADLREADLRRADLSEANLSGADLSEADSSKANLSGAHLREADLEQADVSKADLGGADLREAGLRKADLTRADLSGADLSEADLRRANLNEADLTEAVLQSTDLRYSLLKHARLVRVDLTGADLEDAIVVDTHVQDLLGLPNSPTRLRLDREGSKTLEGEEARRFFRRVEIVEVVLDRRLPDVVLGAYHIFIAECRARQVWPEEVAYLGGRVDGQGTYLRYQADSATVVTNHLPFLLTPFRLSAAVDWKEFRASLEAEGLAEPATDLLATSSGKSVTAEHLQGFAGFADSKPVLVKTAGKTIKIELDPGLLGNLKPGVVFAPKLVLIEGDTNMDEYNIHGDVTGSALGKGAKVNARDITVYKQTVDSSSIPSDIKDLLKQARDALDEAELPDGAKEAVADDIGNLTGELQKDKPDQSKVQWLLDRVAAGAPTVASILKSADIIWKWVTG